MINYANIPAELRERRQWIVWKYILRKGEDKPTKVPYNPVTYREAKSNDPTTWKTFEQARTAYEKHGYDGIGYMFSADDPYSGVDFDACMVDGAINPQVWTMIQALGSYSEASPSQAGIHTIVRGVLPEGGRKSKKHGVEMYDCVRFFTFTGDHIKGTPTTVEDRQSELTALHVKIFGKALTVAEQAAQRPPVNIPTDDRELLDIMLAGSAGDKIQRLWNGDKSAYVGRDGKPDDSSADLSLCNYLAFYTNGDSDRMDRLFRQSKLVRPKWDRPDYRRRTMDKAITGTHNGYGGKGAKRMAATQTSRHSSNGMQAPTYTEGVSDGLPWMDFENDQQGHGNGNGYHGSNGHSDNPGIYEQNIKPLGDVFAAPPLPEHTQLTDEQSRQARGVGEWLKQYLRFATAASPMSPPLFHVCAGIAALSIAVARRIYLRVGTRKIYPNLYILYVGPSTTQRKTEGMNVLDGLMQVSGMRDAFLLPERVTPEAFIEDLSLSIPNTFKRWSQDAQATWLAQRSLPAQRGWLLDEASHLLDSFNRDYTSGMLPLVLDLYDSKDRAGSRLTKSYGLEVIHNAYLTIFGATTFAAMSEHMGKAAHWGNGLFARFAIVTSDTHPAWQFWPEPLEYPDPLVDRIHFISHTLLGDLPQANITTDENGDETILHSGLEERPIHLSPEAKAEWERYAKAVSHDMLISGEIDERLHASYGRLPTMLIKVAMLGAVSDAKTTPIGVEAKHIWWAHGIVEAWREGLHHVLAKGRGTEMRSKADEVRNVLATNGDQWTKQRDLVRKMRCTVTDIEGTLKDLIGENEIEMQERANKNGTKTVCYRLTPV